MLHQRKMWFLIGIIFTLQQVLAEPDEQGRQRIVYKIQVTTADSLGAGTDANVFIKIFGSEAITAVHRLHKSGNQFEKGNTDTFFIEDIDVGRLQQIAIKRDKKWWYIMSPWKLQSVAVKSYGPTIYQFNFNQWIPSNKWVVRPAADDEDVKNDEDLFARDINDGAT